MDIDIFLMSMWLGPILINLLESSISTSTLEPAEDETAIVGNIGMLLSGFYGRLILLYYLQMTYIH